jgi:membrane protein YqaA with SNARE-associated domain
MHLLQLIAAAAPTTRRKIWVWLYHLGGPGLIVLGLVDSSVIPIPGSMDALTIVLSAHHKQLWPYYAAMATIGSVVGGYITFRLARHQGRERLEETLSHGWKKAVADFFKKWRFWAIAVSAVLPPPIPIVPFILAAGATDYSSKRFVGAMTFGRAIRYGILAYFANLYGRVIIRIFSRYGWSIFYAIIALAIFSALAGFTFRHFEKRKSGGRKKIKTKTKAA